MSNTNGTCEYVLDPDDPETWGGEEGDECYVDEDVLNEDGVWTCPYNSEESEEFCLFHLPIEKKEPSDVIDRISKLADDINNEKDEIEEEILQFIGSEFEEFELTKKDTSMNLPVNFSHAVFHGEFDIEGLDKLGKVQFSGSHFFEKANFKSVEITGDAIFNGVNFKHKAIFVGCNFIRNSNFEDAEFKKIANFLSADFQNDVKFTSASFQGRALFVSSQFYNKAQFSATRFNAEAKFGGAKFRGETVFTGNFYQDAEFHSTLFNDDTSFGSARFEGSVTFRESEFEADINFGAGSGKATSLFGDEAPIEVRFNGDVDFNDATFKSGVDFNSVKLNFSSFENCNLTEANLDNTSLRGVNLESSLMSRATLFGADLRGTKLSGAVLGDVRIDEDTQFLGHPEDDTDDESSILDTLSELVVQSRDYCVYDPRYQDDNDGDRDSAKSVYRALEELAGRAARPQLQSTCFVNRQDLQRRQYWDNAEEADNPLEWLITVGKASRAKVAQKTLLYGESPWRVIAWSLGIIFSFALLYPLGGWMKPADGDPITYAQIASNPVEILNSVYYSTLTYTALGFGDFQPVGFGRLLTTLETGLGAVMLALLVFILGRRAAR